MSAPSPAAVKKMLDAKKILDEKRVSETIPQEKVSPTNPKKKSTNNSSRVARSPRGSGRKDRTSKSENASHSRPKDIQKGSIEKTKKPFVRTEHLTQKPLRNNRDLEGLKKSLERKSTGNNRAPHKVPRTSGANQTKGRNGNKENN